MSKRPSFLSPSWAPTVDRIFRGDAANLRGVLLGSTSEMLQSLGLAPTNLTMSAAKIAKARREHPDVTLDVWRSLPLLLTNPLAVFPSARRDGSLVVLLVIADGRGDPIVVPIAPGIDGATNAVLSVYGKADGLTWCVNEMAHARRDGWTIFESKDFAASVPKPGSAEAIPSSPGLIPADGTAKPKRNILSLRKDSTKS